MDSGFERPESLGLAAAFCEERCSADGHLKVRPFRRWRSVWLWTV